MKSAILQFLLFGIIFFLSECSSPPAYNELLFKNDFESIKGWSDTSMLSRGITHSGSYSIKTSPQRPYSYTFKLKFKEIGNYIKKAHFSAWCYSDVLPVKADLIVSVRSNTEENIIWSGVSLEEHIKEARQWVEISGDVDLTKNHANSNENELGFYLWNKGNSTVYLDDCSIQFEQ